MMESPLWAGKRLGPARKGLGSGTRRVSLLAATERAIGQPLCQERVGGLLKFYCPAARIL
jgi:hypothetical protein